MLSALRWNRCPRCTGFRRPTAIVSAVVVTATVIGGITARIFSWQYTESNRQRAETSAIREDLASLRVEVSQTYVTLKAMEMIKSSLDARSSLLEGGIKDLSERLTSAVDRLSDKQDKAVGELVKAVDPQ